MRGTVLRSTGSFYDILGDDGKKYTCKIRGKIRLEGIKETNPVAVGDEVEFEMDREIGAVTTILERKNHILRKSVKKAAQSHVLAANVDQAMVIATLSFPRTSIGFIDRFLVAAESFRIPQLVVFNKKDLLDEESRETQDGLINLYRSIGIKSFGISARKDDLDFLWNELKDKKTLVTGHSGVGKSTLLNKIAPGLEQRTGEVSGFSEKGMHTTTFAEMFPIDQSTFVIDTPGIKEWGLVDMNQQEISDYFPEMRDRRLNCKFGSKCLHYNEPKCAIVEAVERGEIALSRYESYLSILMGDDNRR
jgi:ribosome biogenesis GTPase / thiamine phosphate phosphatase